MFCGVWMCCVTVWVQISQVSVKFSVNVTGNDFIVVDLDYISVEKNNAYMKETFNKK